MLKRVDSLLAALSWAAAAAVVVMLLIGPRVIAEDKAKPTTREVDGKQLFSDKCGSCHTLQAAGTAGQVGPNLDAVSLSAADIEGIVRTGRGGMPAFGGQLSDAEMSAVAAFVAGQR